jgi:glycerol-3-phosphate dehydrogenase
MQSALLRPQLLERLREEDWDLVIVGGGITGAGIALDAASRGLKTALVEKKDFASGTSSKSTKLIHGGLRYLKQLEIGLVREVGSERAVVHKLAPHLVRPEKMLLPLVEGGTYGKLATSMGLWVYDVLAGVSGDDRRIMLSKEQTRAKEPMLRDDILVGGGYYAEYRTDDARLTIENIKTAINQGAVCLNYVAANEFEYDANGHITGVVCQDVLTEDSFTIRTPHVISAAGPWVDELRKEDKSMNEKRLFLSKGVHIVVAHERFPVRQAVYFDVPDGRMIFAIPRLRTTYIGTTDTPYDGDPNRIPTELEDVEYLLRAVNSMFPEAKLTVEDVESSWAGVRPLIYEEGKSASEMSRKDEIFESESGLLSIAGGKLTGYRKMAERVVDRLVNRLPADQRKKLKRNFTDEIHLVGGPFASAQAVREYEKEIARQLAKAGLPETEAEFLVANYGRQSATIIEQAEHGQEATPAERLLASEVQFCIEHELACLPMDYIERRSGRLYFNMPSILPHLDLILDVYARNFAWEDADKAAARARIVDAIELVTVFPAEIPAE